MKMNETTTRGQARKGDRPREGARAKRRLPASEARQATLWEICELMNKEVLGLSIWIRRRVRLYLPLAISTSLRLWKQWNARPKGFNKRPGGRIPAWPTESTNRARAVETCCHWEQTSQRCTWRRGAAKAIGG